MATAAASTPMAVTGSKKLPPFSGTEGIYMLPHHPREIERLQRQHFFMSSTTDGQLLVVPVIHQRKSLRVLDSGAANGTWLRDLARQLPSHNLERYGVDIGSSLFPTSEVGTAVSPQPRHSQALPLLLELDIHIRQWPLVISNLVSALKPGGYIQLVEVEWIDPQNLADEVTRPQLRKQAKLQEWSTASFGMDIHVAYKLERWLNEAGLEDVGKVQFDHGYGALAKVEDQRKVSAELLVECFRNLDEKIPGGGIPGVAANAAEFHRFLDALEVEIKTYGYRPKLNYVYGRKPLAA
ncbi:Uncharacterized protein TPAR_08582 [Tolypocladium paradoxum]|uniref:Methyltransferase n=1 Tax=Tolypocladium paradoxum TaxID=94208 RepID=A0A2S4KLZ3_9HYPO|nr:Uncharacterized protein TPAR_08582 [Tolypocladium paradoxum]